MNKPLDPMSVEKVETPSASYVLRRRYGPARHVIAVASWVTVINMLLQPVVVLAGTVYWDGGGTDDNWSTLNNWGTTGANATSDPSAIPVLSDDVTFYSTDASRLTSGLINQTFAINSLTFGNSQSGAVTIDGTKALIINTGGLTVNSGFGAVSISAPITLVASQTWVNNSTLTVSGNIANGANTLTINGTGTQTFESGATVTALTVANGTVNFNSTVGTTGVPLAVKETW
jgi:hypothetical protein